MRLMVLAITNKFRLFLGVFFALILCQSSLFAQITAPTSSYTSITEYTTGEDQNEIFVFGVNKRELKVVSPDGASGWDFTWTKWNSGTTSFDAHSVENGVAESIVSGLDDGLYHVKVEKGAEVRDYQAWVVNYTKDANKPSLNFEKKNCSGVYFKSTYNPIVQVNEYYDYPNANKLNVPEPSLNPVIFVLKRGTNEAYSQLVSNDVGDELDLLDDDAYSGVEGYKVTVVDRYGFEFDSDLIENISTYAVDATFSFDPEAGEAPLEVNFKLKKDNPISAEYQWCFYKNIKQIPEVDYKAPADRDDLLTDVVTDKEAVYAYMHPGEYKVKLIVTNNIDGISCSESSELSNIVVEGSIFEVPNVFTPNGDDKNDEFRIKLFSVKSYNAKIFNRWGRLVYSFEESDIQYTNAGYDSNIVGDGAEYWKSVKGWNGKINGKLATPGTYFYVIEAEGREEEGKHYTERGSLTLLHDK